jgi:hypothetical protein
MQLKGVLGRAAPEHQLYGLVELTRNLSIDCILIRESFVGARLNSSTTQPWG